ncbi:MAG: hypothetical protein ACPKOI_09085 [Pleomorphochaeta sp.]|jgi:hypothetical protein
MKKTLILLVFSFLLFTSCISGNNEINLQSVPNWVSEKYSDEFLNYYVVEGYGDTEIIAKKDALKTFYDELSSFILIEDETAFINELYDNYSYEDLTIKIIKQFDEIIDSRVHVIFLITADKKTIDEKNLERINREEQITAELKNFEETSNAYYRENKDLQSIRELIDAYIYAQENDFILQSDDYLNMIISRVKALNITVYGKRDLYNLEIRLNREEGFIDPLVIDGEILVSYNSKDIKFDNYLIDQDLYSDNNNLFYFDIENTNINLDGLIIFKINLDEKLKLLRSKNFNDAANQIEFAIKEKVFSYNKISHLADKTIILSTIENDINQNTRESVSTDFLKEKLLEQKANVTVKENLNINNIQQYQNQADYLFLFRAEVVNKEDGLKSIVLSHGSLEVYDLSTLDLVFDSTLIDSMALEDSIEAGESASIIQVARKAFYNFL